jgi:hypothetical protein
VSREPLVGRHHRPPTTLAIPSKTDFFNTIGAQLPFADGADIGRCWNTNRPFVATNPTRRVE